MLFVRIGPFNDRIGPFKDGFGPFNDRVLIIINKLNINASRFVALNRFNQESKSDLSEYKEVFDRLKVLGMEIVTGI